VGTTNAPDSAINLSSVNLFNGYDYNSLIIASPAGRSAYDPRFGMNDLWNAGFQGRLLVKFIF